MFLAEASIQLVPDGTLLIHLIMVVLMVVILNRTLLKPINSILEERDKNILGKVDDAKTLLKARDERLQQYETALRDARTEGYHLLEKERSQALRLKDEKVRAFKQNLNQKLSEEIASTHEQEQQVKQQLEGQAKEIAEMISGQILRR
jgi:F-type H+-transporting ATPase subunit b